MTTRMFMAMLANMEMKSTCNADDGVADDTDVDDPRDDSCDSDAVAAGDRNVWLMSAARGGGGCVT